MKLKDFLIAWGEQSFIAVDQAINAIVTPIFGGGVAYADETLSARTYRVAQKGGRFARFMQPIIDWMFSWQEQDAEINALAGKAVTAHCERAYWKEKLRRNSPLDER